MEFSETTSHNIELIDSVLKTLGVDGVFDNGDFSIDEESAGFYRLVIDVIAREREAVPITLFLEGDGIRVDICGINEAFEWTNEQVFRSRHLIREFLTRLFTSYVLVESCGSIDTKHRLFLFDKNGRLLDKHALRGLIQKYSGWDCDKKLFLPLY